MFITIIVAVYLLMGVLWATLLRSYALQCGDNFGLVDFLLIMVLWPSYIALTDVEEEEEDSGDGTEEG